MGQEGDPPKRVDVKEVLIAYIYRRVKKEKGVVSPDLEAEVDQRGRSRIELICRILEVFGNRKKDQE